jgi:hypothetical protein
VLPRTFTAITVVLSLGVILGALSDKTFAYYPLYVYKFPPEIWRCVTGFMITGSGMSFLFQSYHLYIYMSQLEVGNPRFSKTEDFIWYLMCVGGAILVGPIAVLITNVPVPLVRQYSPSYICPDSALPLQLSRFLEMRKITPALRAGPTFANLGSVSGCRHGGIAYGWPA